MGLVVVTAVAKEWGSVRTVTGRRVWAELVVPPIITSV